MPQPLGNLEPTLLQRATRSRRIQLASALTGLLLCLPMLPLSTIHAHPTAVVEANDSWETANHIDTVGHSGSPHATITPTAESSPNVLEQQLNSPEQALSSLKLFLMVTVLSVAPAVLLMTTSFLRISVVLGLLRQALGTQQNPSNQVIGALALFMSALIMMPTWTAVYEEAIVPYSEKEISGEHAWEIARSSLVNFMGRQIDKAGNSEDVWLFYDHLPETARNPQTGDPSYFAADAQNGITTTALSYHDIPMQALLPAFMISELKTAFLIGFIIFLPFLVLDIVISSVTNAMGMMMLPPTTISLPFKIMLFVLVDGWHLIIGMLLESFV
ncbi:MAG: flagellar type III secretion system pore protein FliP [Planctomycetota bacterium]|nr:flagellar type III secretion system pore protein FliP [Planctomycetota bacterium]